METQLSKAQRAYDIAKRNLTFFKSTPDRRRVIIAEDVISQVRASEIIPEQGTYLKGSAESCTACALGACFVAAAKIDTNIDFNVGLREFQRGMTAQLRPYFTARQLRLIESAFERTDFAGDDNALADSRPNRRSVVGRAIALGRKYEDDKDRLIAIMQNIITNKGRFKP